MRVALHLKEFDLTTFFRRAQRKTMLLLCAALLCLSQQGALSTMESLFDAEKVDLRPYQPNPCSMQGVKELSVVKNIPLLEKTTYHFRTRARLLEDSSDDPHVSIIVLTIQKLTSGDRRFQSFSRQNYVTTSVGWVELGGDFTTLPNVVNVDILVVVYGKKLMIEVDTGSARLEKLTTKGNWKDIANERIDKIRKGNLLFNINIDDKYNQSLLRFKLEQTGRAFGLGTTASGSVMRGGDEQSQRFRDTLEKYFNWATITNDLKWLFMEPKEGDVRFHQGDNFLDGMENIGIQSRGHCVFWPREGRVPKWLVNRSSDEVRETLQRRFKYLGDHYGDRFAHWDLNNEALHFSWYADKLNDSDTLTWMFKEAQKHLPNVKLFVNDYEVVSGYNYNLAYKRQIERLIETGAPIGGIGVQGHFDGVGSIPSDTAAYMKRLSILNDIGLPIWLTEFDVRFKDEDVQVEFLDMIMRLFMSTPTVEGVIFWGFWDKYMRPDIEIAALFEGDDMKITKYGMKFLDLFFREWTSNEEFAIPSSGSITKRVFYGSYNLTAVYDDQALWSKEIKLDNSNGVIYIDI